MAVDAAIVGAPPLGHFTVVQRLTVDGPGRAVIVRRVVPVGPVRMRLDDEAELGILIQASHPVWGIGAEMLCDERGVRQDLFHQFANLLPPEGARLGGQGVMAVLAELFEFVTHMRLRRDIHRGPDRPGRPFGVWLSQFDGVVVIRPRSEDGARGRATLPARCRHAPGIR